MSNVPLTEEEKNLILIQTTGQMKTWTEFFEEIDKAVARCENDARKKALIEIREMWKECELSLEFHEKLFNLLEKEGLD